jgi:hypothetical protein
MDDAERKLADLLHEAAETHHQVYRIVDGADADWASWYGNWLITLSELPQMVKNAPPRSELVCELVLLDRQYTADTPDQPWEQYYATRLLERFGVVS